MTFLGLGLVPETLLSAEQLGWLCLALQAGSV